MSREDILSLAVPIGWQLVPIKPDAAMRAAVLEVASPQILAYGLATWETMLAAAPTPPAADRIAELERAIEEDGVQIADLVTKLERAEAAIAILSEPTHPAAEAPGQGPVGVKPLEWREAPVPPSGECLASSPVGLYCIPLGRGQFVLRYRDRHTLGQFATLEDAKAAAQADYEQRIRSALFSAPPTYADAEPTKEMIQAGLDDLGWGKLGDAALDASQEQAVASVFTAMRAASLASPAPKEPGQ